MLTNRRKEKLKEMLLERQTEMIEKVGSEEISEEMTGELSNYDNHPGDQATELYDKEKSATFQRHAEEELENINEALHAMEDGTYGICRVCSEPISYERLLAIPSADTCVAHSENKIDVPIQEEREPFGEMDIFTFVERYGTSSSSPIDRN